MSIDPRLLPLAGLGILALVKSKGGSSARVAPGFGRRSASVLRICVPFDGFDLGYLVFREFQNESFDAGITSPERRSVLHVYWDEETKVVRFQPLVGVFNTSALPISDMHFSKITSEGPMWPYVPETLNVEWMDCFPPGGVFDSASVRQAISNHFKIPLVDLHLGSAARIAPPSWTARRAELGVCALMETIEGSGRFGPCGRPADYVVRDKDLWMQSCEEHLERCARSVPGRRWVGVEEYLKRSGSQARLLPERRAKDVANVLRVRVKFGIGTSNELGTPEDSRYMRLYAPMRDGGYWRFHQVFVELEDRGGMIGLAEQLASTSYWGRFEDEAGRPVSAKALAEDDGEAYVSLVVRVEINSWGGSLLTHGGYFGGWAPVVIHGLRSKSRMMKSNTKRRFLDTYLDKLVKDLGVKEEIFADISIVEGRP